MIFSFQNVGNTVLKSAILVISFLAFTTYLALAQQPRRDLILECMACHGDDGLAKDKDVPHLAGQNYDYLLNQMKAFHSGKRPHKEMRVMSRMMDTAEMAEIADFYSRLPR